MKKYNVGVMGATGAVGQQMIKVLGERNFPVGELRCLASERSEGKVLSTPFGDVTIQRTCETAFEGLDIVLGASENDIAEAMAPHIKAAGAVFVDNSSAFRLYPDVPLVVPEINPEDVEATEAEYPSVYGRNFAFSGGVAQAVAEAAKEHGDGPYTAFMANGAAECKKQLQIMLAGKFQFDILEGMCLD